MIKSEQTYDGKARGIERMRAQHAQINSDESRELLSQAERAAQQYVKYFRIFLAFGILGAIVLILTSE